MFINGQNLGRYWNIGPQETLYLPGAWLDAGLNKVGACPPGPLSPALPALWRLPWWGGCGGRGRPGWAGEAGRSCLRQAGRLPQIKVFEEKRAQQIIQFVDTPSLGQHEYLH